MFGLSFDWVNFTPHIFYSLFRSKWRRAGVVFGVVPAREAGQRRRTVGGRQEGWQQHPNPLQQTLLILNHFRHRWRYRGGGPSPKCQHRPGLQKVFHYLLTTLLLETNHSEIGPNRAKTATGRPKTAWSRNLFTRNFEVISLWKIEFLLGFSLLALERKALRALRRMRLGKMHVSPKERHPFLKRP